MSVLTAFKNDVRYQQRYGFYLIYLVVSALYALLLGLVESPSVRATATALVLLSDPAVLGFFFIGGIWLLEKEEDLHGYITITPLKTAEYVLAKVASLGLLSTLSASAICLLTVPAANLLLLAPAIFLASAVFTQLGLALATRAKSVNGYMLVSILPAILLLAPTVLAAFGWRHLLLELFPGTLALRVIFSALGHTTPGLPFRFIGLAVWAALLFVLAVRCAGRDIHPKGGHAHAANG